MVERLICVTTRSTVPYENIALEKFLLDHVRPGRCFLYLWQNANTVVIGRNQSALGEVRTARLEADGGRLARRLSGGGAVYHDLGNLNFTFVCRREDYDVERQTEVILQAVRAFGVPARRTGRNDLVVEAGGAPAAGSAPAAGGVPAAGGKFSGHAYYRTGGACYHHGTLMVDVDMDALGRYLRPAPDKLAAKGVQSVRSRVTNLARWGDGLTVQTLACALREAFGAEYGLPVERVDADDLAALGEVAGLSARVAGEELAAGAARFGSREWLFRDERAFEHRSHARFSWGGATLRFALEDGVVSECALDSDGLEADFLAAVPSLLVGCACDASAAERALLAAAEDDGQREVARDVASLLASPFVPNGEAN